jgi:hypothetical protein
MEKEITDIRRELSTLNQRTALILSALVGNELSDDGGIVHRLDTVEKEVKDLRTDSSKYRWLINGIVITVPIYVTILVFLFKQLNIIK